jgi:5-deoxy-glucuronate isomerase
MSSSLLIKPALAAVGGPVHRITPESAGWRYVGFEVFDLPAGQKLERETADREQCLVILAGRASVSVGDRDFGAIGGRRSPFDGKPFAVYAPARSGLRVVAETNCELAVGSAPAEGRIPPRLIRPEDVGDEVRGTGTNTRYIRDVLPASAAAERLLVVEVLTPGGHWSSYPPHKHDSGLIGETQLEEIYYHRLSPPGGFAFQRVYTDDRTLDETLSVEDRDLVLVPRGYHPVSAPHGFELYYLNVMAGPVRRWQVTNAPGYEFITRQR